MGVDEFHPGPEDYIFNLFRDWLYKQPQEAIIGVRSEVFTFSISPEFAFQLTYTPKEGVAIQLVSNPLIASGEGVVRPQVEKFIREHRWK